MPRKRLCLETKIPRNDKSLIRLFYKGVSDGAEGSGLGPFGAVRLGARTKSSDP